MPTYIVAASEGRLSAQQKATVAGQIGHTHHRLTGAPPFLVQVIFHELAAGNAFIGGTPSTNQIFVSGQIRGDRTADTKTSLANAVVSAVAAAADTERFNVWVYLIDLVPTQMAEFGHVLPPAGGEVAWLQNLPDSDREQMTTIGCQEPVL